MSEETAKNPTMNQAFESAKAAENEAAADVPEKEVDGVSSDTKGQEVEPQVEQTDKAADQPDETAEENELLSKEDRENLSPQGKEEYKKLMKAFTPKTQALAAERKSLKELREKFDKFAPMLDAYIEDPDETVRQLARNQGINLADTKHETTPEKSEVETQVSKMTSQLQGLLGEGNEEFASQLATIFKGNMEELASTITQKEIEPIKASQQAINDKATQEGIVADFEKFEAKHPDWKEHESKIVELGKQFLPAEGTSTDVYMDFLYNAATMDQSATETTTKVVERLKKAVESSDPPTDGVKDRIVSPAGPKLPTMREAAAAAAKGVRWEHDI